MLLGRAARPGAGRPGAAGPPPRAPRPVTSTKTRALRVAAEQAAEAGPGRTRGAGRRGDSSGRVGAAVSTSPPLERGVDAKEALVVPNDKPWVWTKQWYAVSPLDYLDGKRPYPIKVMGKDLVIWKSKAGEWSCLEDRCSHRLAPLSEGRIIGDTLMCSYHGWEFKGSGACTNLPHAPTPDANARACSNPRSCVASYPVQDLGRTPDGQTITKLGGIYMRDFPFSYEQQMENLADAAHFTFTHAGEAADRHHKDAGTVIVQDVAPEDSLSSTFPGREGLTFDISMTLGIGRELEKGVHSLVMPDLFTIFTPKPKAFPSADWELLHIRCTPTGPGQARLMVQSYIRGAPWIMRLILALTPTWAGHLRGHGVTEGDLPLLHGQDRTCRLDTMKTQQRWNQQYYMPLATDRPLVLMRRWLDMRGGGGPFPAHDVGPPLHPDVLFNRMDQHTRHCPACQGALRNTVILRAVAAAVSCVLAATALACALSGTLAVGVHAAAGRVPVVCALGAAALAFAAIKLDELARCFVLKGPYPHYAR